MMSDDDHHFKAFVTLAIFCSKCINVNTTVLVPTISTILSILAIADYLNQASQTCSGPREGPMQPANIKKNSDF